MPTFSISGAFDADIPLQERKDDTMGDAASNDGALPGNTYVLSLASKEVVESVLEDFEEDEERVAYIVLPLLADGSARAVDVIAWCKRAGFDARMNDDGSVMASKDRL